MTITLDTPVGHIAAQHPLATRVFARHGIDFCCGGGRPLAEACAAKGLEPVVVIDDIERELGDAPGPTTAWDTAPLDDLIDHIVSTFHEGLREELPRLAAMLEKVHRVHGDKDPERLGALLEVFRGLQAELTDHMMKEERILFPMIERGEGNRADGPVSAMEHEHASAGDALRHIRMLTDDYTPRDDACNTWRALWAGLEQLELDLHQHIHLENNILFPRALAG
ncbi:MAG: iron-sulfur cluster repair di-iron protein [Phycisphaerales bacterium]|jgi:regulator of cell morphogenesis and NO signaling|nr:iron-sulfur cluster repair di-iron protein [Phycisphaerales bacterium]